MDTIVVDAETFYDQKFSLTKLTTEAYIRDPQFEIIGIAVQVNDNEPVWYSGTHAYLKRCLSGYNWKKSLVIAHNAMFDMAIFSWILDIHPARIADTLSMARAIHGLDVGNSLAKLAAHYEVGEKGTEVVAAKGKRRLDFLPYELLQYGEYCKNDVALTYRIFKRLLLHFNLPELRIIDQTIRMFTEPVLRIDQALLEDHLVEIKVMKDEIIADIKGGRESLMSNEKFAEMLRGMGVLPPMKISRTTGKESYAFAKTDEGFKALLEHEDERVQVLCSARINVKSTIEETRTERFIGIAKRGLIPVPLSYYGGHTGRWAGTDKINLQNLPARHKGASKLKASICAPDGYVLINSDSSQIEARVLAWFAGQDDLVEDFRNKRDVYKKMASSIYNLAIEEIAKESMERFVGKETILGAGYSMSAIRFQAQLMTKNVYLELGECERIISTYRATYPAVPSLWREAGRAIEAMVRGKTIKMRRGCLTVSDQKLILPNGLPIKYTNLQKVIDDEGKRHYLYYQGKKPINLYGAKMVENFIQGLARCIIAEQALLIAKYYRWAFTVHDSVIVVVPEDGVDVAVDFVAECMRYVPKWARGCPLDVEVKIGRNYGEC